MSIDFIYPITPTREAPGLIRKYRTMNCQQCIIFSFFEANKMFTNRSSLFERDFPVRGHV